MRFISENIFRGDYELNISDAIGNHRLTLMPYQFLKYGELDEDSVNRYPLFVRAYEVDKKGEVEKLNIHISREKVEQMRDHLNKLLSVTCLCMDYEASEVEAQASPSELPRLIGYCRIAEPDFDQKNREQQGELAAYSGSAEADVKPQPVYKFQLGDRVQDAVTGFTGIAVARLEYITGKVQYCVQAAHHDGGTYHIGEYIDEERLTTCEAGAVVVMGSEYGVMVMKSSGSAPKMGFDYKPSNLA
jgi:hypothetical protein